MTITHTTEQLAMIKQVTDGYTTRISEIEAQLAADPLGWVFCWERYALGVLLTDGVFRVVSVEKASPVTSNDQRVFLNGGNERAVLMSRKWALECALRTTSASLAHFEAAIAKQEV